MRRSACASEAVIWLGVIAAMILGTALRMRGLNRHSIWIDEAFSIRVASHPFSEFAALLSHDTGPPLYYALLRCWILLFGDSETACRMLSVVFGVLSIPAAALLARRVLSPPPHSAAEPDNTRGSLAAVAAAFLVSATPMLVQFSQETRMYSMLALLAVLTMERLFAWLQTGSVASLFLYAACQTLAVWTHAWGFFLIPASLIIVVTSVARRRVLQWIVACAAALLTLLAWAPVIAAQFTSGGEWWIASYEAAPWWLRPVKSLMLFASGIGSNGGEPRSLLPSPWSGLAWLAWVGIILGACLRAPEIRKNLMRGLLFALCPLFVGAAISGLYRGVYLAGRHEIMALPAVLGILAVATTMALPRPLAAGLVSVWVAALAWGSVSMTGQVQRRTPEKAAAAALAPALLPTDRVVFTDLYRPGAEYYLRRAGAAYEGISFPRDAGTHLGWYNDAGYDLSSPDMRREAMEVCPVAGSRTWVLATNTKASRFLITALGDCARVERPFAAAGPPAADIVLATASTP